MSKTPYLDRISFAADATGPYMISRSDAHPGAEIRLRFDIADYQIMKESFELATNLGDGEHLIEFNERRFRTNGAAIINALDSLDYLAFTLNLA